MDVSYSDVLISEVESLKLGFKYFVAESIR
jgi:hypothetical protein